MLQIHFFGALRLVADGAPQVWRAPPKTLPLFAYLLLHRRQPLKRDRLAFTLWPDEGEDAARGNLRRHLHELRRALPASSAGPWLLAEGDVVQWNPAAPYWLDVGEFERFSAAPDTLALAAPLYTGDLLPELYDDWIFFERERLRETLFNCLERLTARCEAQGDVKSAIGYARHILHLDPLREETARTLMALHYRGGDRHAAIQEYRRLAQTLKTELEAPPMPETAALYEIIARGQPLPAASQQPEDRERTWAPPHNLPIQMTSFIGRETEIAALSDLLRPRPGRSPCRLITLTGAGGSGKTRLAIETACAVIEAFPQGVWWVELASLTTGTLVANVVANALCLQVGSGQPVEEALVDYLAGKKLLLATRSLPSPWPRGRGAGRGHFCITPGRGGGRSIESAKLPVAGRVSDDFWMPCGRGPAMLPRKGAGRSSIPLPRTHAQPQEHVMGCSDNRPEAPITHTNHRRDHLFIVRIWLEPGAEVRPAPASGQLDEMGWRGSVQHVRSGRRIYFRRLADLDEFMLGRVARTGGVLEPAEVEFGPAA